MVLHLRRAAMPVAPVVGLAILAACRTSAPPAAIDPALSARVPEATVALAGIDLDWLRASPLYAKLPPGASAFLAPFSHARRVLVAYTGVEIVTIARGVVPGATQFAPDVALSGAADLVAAATTVHPPAAILAPAESVAAGNPLWIAIRGGRALPLKGDLANVNNLLRGAEYVTLTLHAGGPVSLQTADLDSADLDSADLEIAARCPTPDAALHLEQSLRAIVSLGIATSARQPAVSGLLASIRIAREDRVVRVSLSTPLDALVKLVFPG